MQTSLQQSVLSVAMTVESGARGGRTLTLFPTTDFKSVASADSAIAPAEVFYYNLLYKPQKINRREGDLFGGPDGIRTRDLGLDRAAC